jgi:hypothetical protein
MPSKPEPDNGVPAPPTEQQRAELTDVLAEIREAPVSESVRVIPSKPVSRQTTRLLNHAWADFQREVNEIASLAAADEGIDQSCYRLFFTPGGQPAHWAPK